MMARRGQLKLLVMAIFGAFALTSPTYAADTTVAVYPAAAGLVPKNVKERGVLRVASDATYAPYEFMAADNKTMVGYDVDVANAIGATLDLKVRHINASFDSILPGLAAGRYDFAISGFNITPERKKVVDFVGPYDMGGSGLVVAPGNPLKLTLANPLTLCGHAIGGEAATSQLITILPALSKACVKAGKPPITIRTYGTQTQAALAVVSGRADGLISGSAALIYEAQQSHGRYEVAPGPNYDPLPVGIALPKSSPLEPAVKAAFEHIKADGTIGRLLAKWHMPADWLTTAER